jgi:hypothetical protein
MTRPIQILTGVTLLLGLDGLAPTLVTNGNEDDPSVPFAVASIRLEQNATDGDVEIVIEAKGGKDGLAKLTVVSPDGRTVVGFTAPDSSTLGIRQFRFESPEPKAVESLKSAYPEGVYQFAGATAAGSRLHGESRLSHKLPSPAAFEQPQADTRGVGARGLEITWTPIRNLSAYIVYLEQPELNVEITARVPGSAAGFTVPDGFLLPGTEYQLGLGTVSRDGNISFVETTFTTAGEE